MLDVKRETTVVARAGCPFGRVVRIALAVLLVALGGGLASLVYLSLRRLRPPRWWPSDVMLPAECTPEEVSFPSTDGVQLHGWFLAAAGPADLIVLCHGYALSRLETQETALALHRLGHHVLLFDFRAHGLSEGHFTSLGYWEVNDLLGAVAYLRGRPEYIPGRLGVLGFSMGAVTAILATARCHDISAIVADSSYAALDHIIVRGLRHAMRLPGTSIARLIVFLGEALSGLRASSVRPVRAVGQIAPRPLLIVHGEQDVMVPVAEAHALYEAAGEPRDLWIVPGAGHVMARFAAPEAYIARIHEFFHRYLAGPR